MSTLDSSFKFFPYNIFLLSRITPSDSSLEDLMKYFTMGKAPEIKSSPSLRIGYVFIGL